MSNNSDSKIKVNLSGRDFLELCEVDGKCEFHFSGCYELHTLLLHNRKQNGDNIKNWPMPTGVSHSELLLKELLLKIKKQWSFPYQADELCHCRNVKTETVDQAIIAGAHTPEMVSQWTSASTACGTCRPEVEKIIKYRLEIK